MDINAVLGGFLAALDKAFGERVWFVGLQGSYARGEATEKSDVDIVVILDEVSAQDIEAYSNMLDTLPNRGLFCGFLSGKNEIFNWEPSDLFQFYHDTVPVRGSLDELSALIDGDALDRAIKIGVCNIYHGCVHNMIYEKSEEILAGLYKSASFVIQAICFKQTGKYVRQQKDLSKAVSADDKAVIDTFIDLKNGKNAEFRQMSERLFLWAQRQIK